MSERPSRLASDSCISLASFSELAFLRLSGIIIATASLWFHHGQLERLFLPGHIPRGVWPTFLLFSSFDSGAGLLVAGQEMVSGRTV